MMKSGNWLQILRRTVVGLGALGILAGGRFDTARAVIDQPLHACTDSTGVDMVPKQQGGGTLWMIASALLDQGDVKAALPYLNDAWRLSPDIPEIGRTLRDIFMQQGYLADALNVSRRLQDLPDVTLADETNHVIILAANGHHDEAFGLLQLLQDEQPDNLDLIRLQGDLLIRQKRWREAELVFTKLRELDPEDPETATGALAEIAVMRGDGDQARAEWRRGLRDDPGATGLRMSWIRFELAHSGADTAFALAARGDRLGFEPPTEFGSSWVEVAAGLLLAANQRGEAKQQLLDLASGNQLGVQATLMLAQILSQDDQGPRAIRVLRAAIAAAPDVAPYHAYLAEFLSNVGDHVEAEEQARRAQFLDPTDPLIGYSLITIIVQRYPHILDRTRSAALDSVRNDLLQITRHVEAISSTPTPSQHMLLGATYASLGKAELAIPHFELAATDSEMRHDALLNLSVAYDKLGREDELMKVLEDLVAENPDDATSLNALGYTLAVRGLQLERAESMIRKALKSDPENPAFLDSLAWTLHQKGQDLDSFDYLVKAANGLPEDPEILEHLARVLSALGQKDRARHVAAEALAAGGDPADLADLLGEGGQ